MRKPKTDDLLADVQGKLEEELALTERATTALGWLVRALTEPNYKSSLHRAVENAKELLEEVRKDE